MTGTVNAFAGNLAPQLIPAKNLHSTIARGEEVFHTVLPPYAGTLKVAGLHNHQVRPAIDPQVLLAGQEDATSTHSARVLDVYHYTVQFHLKLDPGI